MRIPHVKTIVRIANAYKQILSKTIAANFQSNDLSSSSTCSKNFLEIFRISVIIELTEPCSSRTSPLNNGVKLQAFFNLRLSFNSNFFGEDANEVLFAPFLIGKLKNF